MADEKTGSENASGTSDDTRTGDDKGDTSQSASGAAGGSQTESDDDAEGTSNDAVVSRDEFEQLKRRMQAADQRASRAEQELNEKKRAEQDEVTNLKQDLETAQKTIGELQTLIDKTALENAFFKNNKHTWHDPADALALLDREGVEVKDGTVTGLGPAIEKLAKAKPHLLKSESDSGGGKGSSEASGSANNGTRKGGKQQVPDKQRLASRFPALRH